MEATFRHFQKPQDGKIKEFCIYDVSQKMAYLVKVDQLSDQKITPPIKEKVGGGGPLSFPVGYNKKNSPSELQSLSNLPPQLVYR